MKRLSFILTPTEHREFKRIATSRGTLMSRMLRDFVTTTMRVERACESARESACDCESESKGDCEGKGESESACDRTSTSTNNRTSTHTPKSEI